MSEEIEPFEEWKVLDSIIFTVRACKHLLQESKSLDDNGLITLKLSDFKESCGFSKAMNVKLFHRPNAYRIDACNLLFKTKIWENDEDSWHPEAMMQFVLDSEPQQSMYDHFRTSSPLAYGNHEEHDKFISEYMDLNSPSADVIDSCWAAKVAEMKDKKNVVAFCTARVSKSVSEEMGTRIHKLALYIMMDQYPEEWVSGVMKLKHVCSLLCSMLLIIRDAKEFKPVYPPRWTKKIFRLENTLSPTELHGVIFGIDPLSGGSPIGDRATGYAFTFDSSEEKDSSLMKGLYGTYGLKDTIDLHDSATVDRYLVKEHGIGLVNYIRTIRYGSKAGSANRFHKAWAEYNLHWLTAMNSKVWKDGSSDGAINVNRVLIFQNPEFPFKGYCGEGIKKLLPVREAPRCTHPSHIIEGAEHCINDPKCVYKVYDRKGKLLYTSDDPGSVEAFKTYLTNRGASKLLCCQCSKCELKLAVAKMSIESKEKQKHPKRTVIHPKQSAGSESEDEKPKKVKKDKTKVNESKKG